jgi:hypothetical protein
LLRVTLHSIIYGIYDGCSSPVAPSSDSTWSWKHSRPDWDWGSGVEHSPWGEKLYSEAVHSRPKLPGVGQYDGDRSQVPVWEAR